MTVIVREYKNKYSKTYIKTFKRKGIRYYLFIFSLKVYNIEYETYEDNL